MEDIDMAINVTIWNENVHEKVEPIVANIHPEGLHGTLKNLIACDDFAITTATLDMPEQGLPADVLNKTDVLIWWGHAAHGAVEDSLVERIYDRVNAGTVSYTHLSFLLMIRQKRLLYQVLIWLGEKLLGLLLKN